MKSYIAYYSDGKIEYVKGETVNDAYRKAMKSGIGRYVKRMVGYDDELVYFTIAEGFVEPHEYVRIEAAKCDLDFKIGDIIREMLECSASVYIGDDEYYCKLMHDGVDYGPESHYVLVYGGDKNIIYRKFKVTISFEEVTEEPAPFVQEPNVVEETAGKQRHEWAEMKCIHCGQDLFDVDDPNGFCNT